jgi:hypothetical protein
MRCLPLLGPARKLRCNELARSLERRRGLRSKKISMAADQGFVTQGLDPEACISMTTALPTRRMNVLGSLSPQAT